MGDLLDLPATQRDTIVESAAALRIAVQMRTAQKAYFKTRCREDLLLSKALEKEFDQMAAAIQSRSAP